MMEITKIILGAIQTALEHYQDSYAITLSQQTAESAVTASENLPNPVTMATRMTESGVSLTAPAPCLPGSALEAPLLLPIPAFLTAGTGLLPARNSVMIST